MIFHDTVAATCTEAGSASYYTCSECCKVFWDADGKQEIDISETYLKPLGHDWATNFTIDIPATKTSTGEMSLHCKRCNERSRITEIPKLTDNNDSDDPDFDDPNQNNNNPGNGQSVNKTIPPLQKSALYLPSKDCVTALQTAMCAQRLAL